MYCEHCGIEIEKGEQFFSLSNETVCEQCKVEEEFGIVFEQNESFLNGNNK